MAKEKLFYPGQEVVALFSAEDLVITNPELCKVIEIPKIKKDDIFYVEEYKKFSPRWDTWYLTIRGIPERHLFMQEMFAPAGNITELTDILEEEAKHAGVNQGLVRRIMNFVRVNFGSVW